VGVWGGGSLSVCSLCVVSVCGPYMTCHHCYKSQVQLFADSAVDGRTAVSSAHANQLPLPGSKALLVASLLVVSK